MQEPADSLQQCLQRHGLKLAKDHRLDWSTNGESHPRRWGLPAKAYTTAVVIWLEAYMTAISSAGTATSTEAIRDYNTTRTIGILCFVTVYLVGQAIGGVFLAPLSEVFGRKTIYGIGTLAFCIFSIVTGVPDHLAAATIGRFCQGVAASIPATVAFANFNDLFDTHTRVWVVYFYTLFGMAGLALGPIYSSYITAHLGWRWVYHISAITSAVSAVACLFMRESDANQILHDKVKVVRKETGDASLEAKIDHIPEVTVQSFFRGHIRRPLHFLFTEPVVGLCAILCSIAFALIYGATESLSLIYTSAPFVTTFPTKKVASLAFVPILIGEFLNVFPRIYDDWHLKQLHRKNRQILPESKIRSFSVACPALAVGLWILAWTIPPHVTSVAWPVSMVGLVLVGFAANDFSYVLFGYVTDSYGQYAASAVSAVSSMRTLAAAIFPLFVTFQYEGMGNNYATTLLAIIATLFCFTPWLFLRKGKNLRERSKYAVKGEDAQIEDGEDNEKQSQSSADS